MRAPPLIGTVPRMEKLVDSEKRKQCGTKVFGVGVTKRRRGLLQLEEKDYTRGGVIRGKRPVGVGVKVGIW